ncbi:DUF6053 domain-containing protein [Lysobacter enzymogenes]|uniref:DUF6053 domain-containing protein n=1 Tax=Lysobacter enzymogenes TaxID=69 RepID=UPI003D18E34E
MLWEGLQARRLPLRPARRIGNKSVGAEAPPTTAASGANDAAAQHAGPLDRCARCRRRRRRQARVTAARADGAGVS